VCVIYSKFVYLHGECTLVSLFTLVTVCQKESSYCVATKVSTKGLCFFTQQPSKDHTRVPVLGGEVTTDSGENSSIGSCSLGKRCAIVMCASKLSLC